MSLKIWCISDTHGKHEGLEIPDVDMVIHAGDMGTFRQPSMNEKGLRESLDWYSNLSIKYKILIAGNHDTSIETGLITRGEIESKGISYLEHEIKNIGGLNIFGSPYTPSFGIGWAFNVKRSKLDAYWTEIPSSEILRAGADIIVTHGPPLGILDHTECGVSFSEEGGSKAVMSCGDKSLLNHIKRVKPLFHVYGHIHPESRCNNNGITQLGGLRTKFVNAAVVDLDYNIHNNGHIIEI